MVTLVIGGSGSGKSRYAEKYICSLPDKHKRYYIATMEAIGEEGRARVIKHRRQRADKGFVTIERPRDLSLLPHELPDEPVDILLECVSNLVANEMFSPENQITDLTLLKENIVGDIKRLCDKTANTVIVSNNVFEDGYLYDSKTEEYIKLLALVNQELAVFSDAVTEVVAGIPLVIK